MEKDNGNIFFLANGVLVCRDKIMVLVDGVGDEENDKKIEEEETINICRLLEK